MNLLIEVVSVGMATVIIGGIVLMICGLLMSNSNKFNYTQIYVIGFSLFITGALIHLVCEYSGVNKWYCKNGNACVR